jgi:lipopolysaccharide transport system permease protein
MFRSLAQNRGLILSLIQREVAMRYKGSFIGLGWYVVNNLVMLLIYTVVFGSIFNVRWPSTSTARDTPTIATFALMLFAGLIVYNIAAECLVRAPTLILSNVNYVKKVVFPLEALPVVSLGVALFNAAIGLLVLVVMAVMVGSPPAATAVLAPLVILPLLPLILGLSWFLASAGVYIRDIAQVVALLTNILLFLSPIFYPKSAMPGMLRVVVILNPITVPVEELRRVMFEGVMPDWLSLAFLTAAGLCVAALGYFWFEKTKRGFGDVL